MGFKLGAEIGNHAIGGEIKTKMRNMDGSIYISDKLQPGGVIDRHTISHEMRHATDMRIGKLEYADDYIKYNGETFPRETIKGKDMINIWGEWKEAGSHDFPWEMDANNGNKK